jgi:hypothetical protein
MLANDRGYHDRLVRHYEMWNASSTIPRTPRRRRYAPPSPDTASYRIESPCGVPAPRLARMNPAPVAVDANTRIAAGSDGHDRETSISQMAVRGAVSPPRVRMEVRAGHSACEGSGIGDQKRLLARTPFSPPRAPYASWKKSPRRSSTWTAHPVPLAPR